MMMMSFIYFLQKQQPVRVPGPAQLPKPDTTHVLLLLNGNSAEKIVELEKEYDFTDVSLKEFEQAKKWFQTVRPSSSNRDGPTVTSAYRLWMKWNLTRTGAKSRLYKGDLIRKREEEAGAALK